MAGQAGTSRDSTRMTRCPAAVERAGQLQRLGHLPAADQHRLRGSAAIGAPRGVPTERAQQRDRPASARFSGNVRSSQRRASVRRRLSSHPETRRIRVQPVAQRDSTCSTRGSAATAALNAAIAAPLAVGSPGVQGCALHQGVVDADHGRAARAARLSSRTLEVVEIARLVGVDEHEVERLPSAASSAQRVHRRADLDVDPAARRRTRRNTRARIAATSASTSHATTTRRRAAPRPSPAPSSR